MSFSRKIIIGVFLLVTVGMLFFYHKSISENWGNIPYEKYILQEQENKKDVSKQLQTKDYIKYNAYWLNQISIREDFVLNFGSLYTVFFLLCVVLFDVWLMNWLTVKKKIFSSLFWLGIVLLFVFIVSQWYGCYFTIIDIVNNIWESISWFFYLFVGNITIYTYFLAWVMIFVLYILFFVVCFCLYHYGIKKIK